MPRYKALLLKQRDIMIALTERLRERDDRIIALQEEHSSVQAQAQWAPAPVRPPRPSGGALHTDPQT